MSFEAGEGGSGRFAYHCGMPPILSVRELNKTYAGGFVALKNVSLDIERGEIFALLGPNGAGKTTLINIICGIVNPTSGTALVNGHDIVTEFRKTRGVIGLVPQELPVETFESVWKTANFSPTNPNSFFSTSRPQASTSSSGRACGTSSAAFETGDAR